MQAAAAVLCAWTEGVGVSAQNAVRPPMQHFSTRDVSLTVTAPRHTAPYETSDSRLQDICMKSADADRRIRFTAKEGGAHL